MRPFTPFASYHDNTGHLLVGRVRFCDTDDHPAEVFDEDGVTTLGSAVFTDSSGRLVQQPFLADHDYIVHFDKYIGGSNTMAEDDDDESWEEQGSAIDRYNTLGVSLTADSMRNIGTIAELRTTVALSDDEILVLMGYNSAGDKDPISYRWVANSTEPDNGGSVIAVSGVQLGRWEFVECPRVLDVRHFGAFPEAAVESATQQRYRIQGAGDYAHEYGCGLFFPSNDIGAYYDISGLHLYDVDCSENARIFCISNVGGTTVEGIGNVHCTEGVSCRGIIRLVSDVVRSSWEGYSSHVTLAPVRKLIVDSQIRSHGVGGPLFSGINVEILEYNTLTLDGCQVSSNKKIEGPVTMRNMEVLSAWFADDYDYANDLNVSGCTLKLDNLKSAQAYVVLKNKQQESDYGDLGGQNVSGVTLAANCNVSNARLVNVVLEGASEMRSVAGSVKVKGACNWNNCVIEMTNDSMSTIQSLTLRQSTLTASNANGAISSPYIDAEDSDISVTMTCASSSSAVPSLRLVGCKLHRRITHTASKVVEDVQRCEFLGTDRVNSGRIFISFPFDAQWGGSVVAKWIGNHAESPDPIKINRFYMQEADSAHAYVYEDNTGTFLPKKFTKFYDGVFVSSDNTSSPQSNTLYYTAVPGGHSIILRNNADGVIAFREEEFFSVGISDKYVKALFWLPLTVNWGYYARSIPVHLVARHIQSTDPDAGGVSTNDGNRYQLYCRFVTAVMEWPFDPTDNILSDAPAGPTTQLAVDYELL